jgi:stage V sporulation protein S
LFSEQDSPVHSSIARPKSKWLRRYIFGRLENFRMDRFFSKLDLRDIKIKPEGSRFLPDDDETELIDEQTVVAPPIEDDSIDLLEADPGTFEAPHAGTNGHHLSATYERVTVEEWDVREVATEQPARASENGGSETEVLKVSAKSRPSAVAGAIAGVVRESGRAEVQAIGAGATNQAVKAIAIAREYLLETEIDAVCVPAFIDVIIDNEERTAIRLVIERR